MLTYFWLQHDNKCTCIIGMFQFSFTTHYTGRQNKLSLFRQKGLCKSATHAPVSHKIKMPKLSAVLAEESLQKQATVYINRSFEAPLYKPKYYSDQLETTNMKIVNMIKNRYRRCRRYWSAFYMQEFYCPAAESSPLLRKKLILVTGGSDGLGFETALKLVWLGAVVTIASDNLYKADRAVQAIRALIDLGREKSDLVLSNFAYRGPEGILSTIKRYKLRRPMMLADENEDNCGQVHSVYMNLADLKSVVESVLALKSKFKGRFFDHVVLAASVCPEDNVFTLQGHELAFATNVLGHFALINLFLEHKLLRIESQVLVVGCEDYILAEDCTTDFKFQDQEEFGYSVYRRSKLGQFWFSQELQRRFGYLSVCIVHPGYLDNRLGMDSLFLTRNIIGFIALSPRSAANVIVVCVQYSSTLPKGVYYHNTCGQMILDSREIALNEERASEFWEMMYRIYSDYMRMYLSSHTNINRENLDDGGDSFLINKASAPRYVAVN